MIVCNFTLAARGASADFVDFSLDTPIHKRTYARRNLFTSFTLGFFGVRLFLLLGGAANVKYGRRSRFEFWIFYVVCVSRSRIGLDVIYVHVKTNTSLRRTWEQCTLGYVHGRRMRTKRQSRQVIIYLHKTRPPLPHLNYARLRRPHLCYAAATYGASAL